MSAGGAGGGAKGAYPPQTIMALGIIGGLVGIYLGHFMPPAYSFFGGIGAICATVWGADAVRRVASYGLGTGFHQLVCSPLVWVFWQPSSDFQ